MQLSLAFDRASWLCRCEAPWARRRGLRLLEEALAGLTLAEGALSAELVAALRAQAGEARADADLAARRLGRSGSSTLGSVASGVVGAATLLALLGLAWRLMEPAPIPMVLSTPSPQPERVAIFLPGVPGAGLGGSSPGPTDLPGQPAAMELPEGGEVAQARPGGAVDEGAGTRDAGRPGGAVAPEVQEGAAHGQDAVAQVQEAPLVGQDEAPPAPEGGRYHWEGSGLQPRYQAGQVLASQPWDVDAALEELTGRTRTGALRERSGGGRFVREQGAAGVAVEVAPPPPEAPEPEVAETAVDADGEALADASSGSEAAGWERDPRATRRRGPRGGIGVLERQGLGGVWAGIGGRARQAGGTGGLGGGGDAAYVALRRSAPMVFRTVGRDASDPDGAGPFQVAETEATQGQYFVLMGLDLGSLAGQWDHPTHRVSWCAAIEYANALSRAEGLRRAYHLDGDCAAGGGVRWDTRSSGFRLLTEAEWEALAAEASGEGGVAPTSNNLGLGPVQISTEAESHGLLGVQGNAGEWVWGGAAAEGRYLQAGPGQGRAVGRVCLANETAQDGPCRVQAAGHERHLALGFRLARGAPALSPGATLD